DVCRAEWGCELAIWVGAEPKLKSRSLLPRYAHLRLCFETCLVMICSGSDKSNLLEVLASFGEPVKSMLMDFWAMSLGVSIGPEVHKHVWQDLVPKFSYRIRLARQRGLGLVLSFVAFRVMGVSFLLLRFHMYPAQPGDHE
ncbi:unnamed protein product, partial [Prorocentrum cordatum]